MNLFEYTYDLVRQIPPEKLSTYGAVANALGDKIAARAVGRMMNQNPDADTMPCFKIVHSDGKLGGFGLGTHDKIRRLNQDNIQVKKGEIIDFQTVFFNDFKTNYPLKKLREEQIKLSKQISTKDDFSQIKTVAGFDVAYPKSEFEKACGAAVVIDYKTKQIIEQKTVFVQTHFPYISTYLVYRELPIIKHLVKSLTQKPTVMMFDGNGILHPYKIGLASHAGIQLNTPSIGVAKRLLYGQVEKETIKINNEKRGYAIITSKKAKTPIYISPGHKISLKTTKQIVKNLCNYKTPEPLRQAHLLAKNTLESQTS